MKNRIIFSLLFVFGAAFSLMAKQEKYIKHTVVKGETITQISQKYKVTPYDIYKLNPDSQNGIQLNSVLLIPSSTVQNTADVQEKPTEKPVAKSTATTHLVQPKETMYSISKLYNVTIDELKEANGDLLNNGLKIGQNIKIPASSGTSVPNVTPVKPAEIPKEVVKETPKEVVTSAETKVETSASGTIYHVIQPKETKYAISKKYGITIDELEKLNPQTVTSFPIGLKLLISGKRGPVEPATNDKPEVVATTNTSTGKRYFQEYLVKPKETVSSISANFGITEGELLALNPELKKGVKLGMILRVPKVSEDEKKKL